MRMRISRRRLYLDGEVYERPHRLMLKLKLGNKAMKAAVRELALKLFWRQSLPEQCDGQVQIHPVAGRAIDS